MASAAFPEMRISPLPLIYLALVVLCAPGVHGQSDRFPLESIESAIQSATFSTNPVPVVIRGIVIFNHHEIVIEDRTGATEVAPEKMEPLALGDEVEVTGAMMLTPRPTVRDGQIHRLWGGSTPLPLSITADEAAGGENELSLVQTVAELVNFVPAGLTGVRLNLRAGHQSFSAVLPNDSVSEDLPTKSLQGGATLRLTGILMVNHDPTVERGDAFSLLLRTPQDIELMEPPPWWTGPHLMMLAGVGVILFLIGISAYYRVNHARYRALAEERTAIARDIHDTLAQGYAGITLQLEALEQTIGRDPDRARDLLSESLKMVRHSRDESHLSIDILRSFSRNERLDALIAHCIQQLRAASGAVIEQQVSGEPSSLSYKVVSNLFRITQEALVNAVNHARANRTIVRIGYRKGEVQIEVADNGRGFNPATISGPEQGHFGLTGIRERCAAINAKLELDSGSGGTTIRVRVEL
jgi:two-component sensor histidine kinase